MKKLLFLIFLPFVTFSQCQKEELKDPDGKDFKKGDFVSFKPGTKHSSYTKKGCLVLVFMRGINKSIK